MTLYEWFTAKLQALPPDWRFTCYCLLLVVVVGTYLLVSDWVLRAPTSLAEEEPGSPVDRTWDTFPRT